MARVSYRPIPATPFRRLLGHNPALLDAFAVINRTVEERLSLPGELREEVRRHLAHAVGSRV